MWLEILKLFLTLATGGVAVFFLQEWRQRRRNRVQQIQLIERVNREVSPKLHGFTLVRDADDQDARREPVRNLRQYELTLRNGTSTHLLDAEIQFEFPAEEVSAWVSRPTLSKAPLVFVPTSGPLPQRTGEQFGPPTPWVPRVFRWKIPHFPSGDSVEFSFQAVNANSNEYEAALEKSSGIILQKVTGEPPSRNQHSLTLKDWLLTMLIPAVLILVALGVTLFPSSGAKTSAISLGGCDLQITSTYDLVDGDYFRIEYRIFNGDTPCVVQLRQLDPSGPITMKPATHVENQPISAKRPKITDVAINIGNVNTKVKVFMAP